MGELGPWSEAGGKGRARQPGTQLRSDKLGQSQRASGHPCGLGWEMLAWCVSEMRGGAGEQCPPLLAVRPQDVRTSQKPGDAERKSTETTARESDSGDRTAARLFRGRTLLTAETGLSEDETGPGESTRGGRQQGGPLPKFRSRNLLVEKPRLGGRRGLLGGRGRVASCVWNGALGPRCQILIKLTHSRA